MTKKIWPMQKYSEEKELKSRESGNWLASQPDVRVQLLIWHHRKWYFILSACNQKQNGMLASKLWRLLFLLRKADRKFWTTVQFSVFLYLRIIGLSIRRIHIFGLYFFCQILNLKPHFFSRGPLFLLSKILFLPPHSFNLPVYFSK